MRSEIGRILGLAVALSAAASPAAAVDSPSSRSLPEDPAASPVEGGPRQAVLLDEDRDMAPLPEIRSGQLDDPVIGILAVTPPSSGRIGDRGSDMVRLGPVSAVLAADEHLDMAPLPEIRSGQLGDPVIGILPARVQSGLQDEDHPGAFPNGLTHAVPPDRPGSGQGIVPLRRQEIAPDAGRPRAIPNPSTGPVLVRAATQATVTVSVYDVNGRRLAELSGPSGAAEWDGRDLAGRPVPSGVYFARVQAERSAAKTVRIVRR